MKNVKMCRLSFLGTYVLTSFLLILIFLYDFIFGISKPWKFALILLSLLIAAEPEFKRAITNYRFEVERIVKEVGLIAKKRVEIPYANVAQIVMKKSVFGRLLNYGDIIVVPTSGVNSALVLSGLKNPEKYVGFIEAKMKKFKK